MKAKSKKPAIKVTDLKPKSNPKGGDTTNQAQAANKGADQTRAYLRS